jgi:hypothetical protein
VLSGHETKLADELHTLVHNDELLGFIISNDLGLPIDEHEEVKDLLAVGHPTSALIPAILIISEGSVS